MGLTTCKQERQELAGVDPFWAIVTDPGRKFGKWDIKEFMRTGEQDILYLFRSAKRLDHPLGTERALDIGCGIGRHTRILARHFGECYGVDVSARMIAEARDLNHHIPNCRFVVNSAENLQLFPNNHFDLVYSILVSKAVDHVLPLRIRPGDEVRGTTGLSTTMSHALPK